MKIERVRHQGVVNFHAHLEFSPLIVNSQFLGFSKVAVRVGRQLHQLSVIIPVSSRYLNRTRRLGYEEPALLRVQHYPVVVPRGTTMKSPSRNGRSPNTDSRVPFPSWTK